MSSVISPGAVVCNEAMIVGDVSIGARTVVHPRAVIIAEAGPIIIGENNLIEEQAHIVNTRRSDTRDVDVKAPADNTSQNATVMIIGNNNVFEVDCRSFALKMGDNNVLESKCVVGRATELTNGCVVGAGCKLTAEEVLPENTVVFGECANRRKQADKPTPQTLQIDFLSKVLPNYHHLKKPTKK